MRVVRLFFLCMFFSLPLFCTIGVPDVPTKEEEKDFAFDPWYTGPLVGGSGTCYDPGIWNFQTIFLFGSFDKNYTSHGKTVKISKRTAQDILVYLQTGLVKGADLSIGLEQYNVRVRGKSAHVFGDTEVYLGIQLHSEEEHIPAIRLIVSEKFPTGKYEYLNPLMEGADGLRGSGCFTTTFRLVASNILYWLYRHPISWRINLSQSFPTSTWVHEFHSYGGGFGTLGKVYPSSIFNGVFSFEFSFTQRWVFAMDFWYNRATRSRFSGRQGRTALGAIAKNTSRYYQSYFLTPAIEYNINIDQGFLAGFLITLYGHNTEKLCNSFISYEITF
jgi:hypothetical protein